MNWMSRPWILLATLVLLAACHSENLPPIDGSYTLPDGQQAQLHGGRFLTSTTAGQGSYTVDGTHVTVRLDHGPKLEGERLDADHLQLTVKDGQQVPPVDLYRAGTPAATEVQRATAARMGHPIATDADRAAQASAAAATAFTPDVSMGLDNYTPLDRGDDLHLFELAHMVPAATDEQVLSTLVPGYAQTSDSFRRKDMATAALPGLRTRLDAMRAQHYFSVSVRTMATDPSGANIQAALMPYDLEHQAFPVPGLAGGCLNAIDNSRFRVTAVRVVCSLPVADEAAARAIEAARARLQVALEGRAYFGLTRDVGATEGLPVELLHAHLEVTSRADPALRVVADLSHKE